MKIDLKKKVMLAVLAGGMLCANSVLAAGTWYGTTGNRWTTADADAVASGLTLTLDAITLDVDGNSWITEGIEHFFAGYINSGTASNNKVYISNSAFTGMSEIVAANVVNSGTAEHNEVYVTNNSGTMDAVIGARLGADPLSSAEYNKVYVTNTNVLVTGGAVSMAGTVDAKYNEVYIDSGDYNSVFGSLIAAGDASENLVKISDGNFTFDSSASLYSTIAGSYVFTNGNAIKNSVTIENGVFDGAYIVVGGQVETGDAKQNKLTIKNGSFWGCFAVGGGYVSETTGTGNAEGNEVIIENGDFIYAYMIVGGIVACAGDAMNNTLTIKGGNFSKILAGIVAGMASTSGDATNNILTIEGGNFAAGINFYGGMAIAGTSSGNTLNLKTVINGTVAEVKDFQKVNFTIPAGATSDTVMMRVGNSTPMALSGIDFTTDLNGLSLTTGDYITLVKGVDGTDGALAGHTNFYVLDFNGTKELVYANGMPTAKGDYTIKQVGNKFDSGTTGSYSEQINGNTTDGGLSDTSYSGNEVIIRRGTYSGRITGAKYTLFDAVDLSVNANTVTIYDGSFSNDIYGGYIFADYANGDANNNKVTIYGGTFDYINIGAGRASPPEAPATPVNGNANGNTLIVNGGNFINYSYASDSGVWGGSTGRIGNANENKVYINGGTFDKRMGFWGGYNDAAGEASNNYVEINGGSFDEQDEIIGGWTRTGSANGNFVTVNSGTFGDNGIICGGYLHDDGGDVSNNTVIINGGIFEDDCVIKGAANDYSSTGNICGNIVRIKGGSFAAVSIYGCSATNTVGEAKDNLVEIEGGTFADDFSLYGARDAGFATNNTLNLKIKMSGKAGEIAYFQTMNFTLPSNITNGDVMLKTDSLYVDSAGGEATINVYAANGVKLQAGDVITLIQSEYTCDTFIGGDVLGGAGEVSMTDGSDGDPRNVILTLLRDFEQKKTAGNEDQQKAPVEGIAAAMQTVNMSADLASGQGMASLLANTAGGTTDTFGAMSAGSSKYKTGSHVDVDGWGVLVGAGKTKEWKDGSAITYGLFFEYGKGDFDTYNGNVHGDGNSKNQGIGIMMRHKMLNNTYYEGNIRYGKQSTEWSESELGSYDTDSKYYGIMVGMGHIFPAGKNEIDVYGRYTFGHVGACDATVGDSHYNFESVKSHRVRLGAKYNFVQEKSNAKPFIGLAWEHEFKGESKASISGVGEAPAPSMKGHTGIFELGCDWDVSKKWTLGLGANAYMGKRKGWDGMARVFYNF